jgi:hypothetical protein
MEVESMTTRPFTLGLTPYSYTASIGAFPALATAPKDFSFVSLPVKAKREFLYSAFVAT